LNISKNK